MKSSSEKTPRLTEHSKSSARSRKRTSPAGEHRHVLPLRNAFGDLDRRVISEQVTTRYVSLIALAIDRKDFKTEIGLLGRALRGESVSGLVSACARGLARRFARVWRVQVDHP